MIEYVVQYRTRSSGRVMYESSSAIAYGQKTSKKERARRWPSNAEAQEFAARQRRLERDGIEVSVRIA